MIILDMVPLTIDSIMKWKDKECLHLVLMKDPFERIAKGEKVIEYREDTPYWEKRLKDKYIKYIYFQYAYHKEPTHMVVEVKNKKLTDRWELHLGNIIHFENNHIKDLECNNYNIWYKDLMS